MIKLIISITLAFAFGFYFGAWKEYHDHETERAVCNLVERALIQCDEATEQSLIQLEYLEKNIMKYYDTCEEIRNYSD